MTNSGLDCDRNLDHFCIFADFVTIPRKYPGLCICNLECALASALANERKVSSASNAQERGLNSAVRSFYRLSRRRFIETLNFEDFTWACFLIDLP